MPYLTLIDDASLRSALVTSLREHLRRAGGGKVHLARRQIVYTALLELAKRPGVYWSADAMNIANRLEEAYNRSQGDEEDVARIETAIWALVAAGVVYPQFQHCSAHHPEQYPLVVKYLVVTSLGVRYLSEGTFHPVAPDFITEAVSGLDNLPAEVIAALEDAQLCFQHRLLRASVVQLGLAYEIMASEVYKVIVPADKPRDAKKVLDKIRKAVEKDEAATRAVAVADEIRNARNTAAHNWKHDFQDTREVETLLILGGRNVATFWRLRSRS